MHHCPGGNNTLSCATNHSPHLISSNFSQGDRTEHVPTRWPKILHKFWFFARLEREAHVQLYLGQTLPWHSSYLTAVHSVGILHFMFLIGTQRAEPTHVICLSVMTLTFVEAPTGSFSSCMPLLRHTHSAKETLQGKCSGCVLLAWYLHSMQNQQHQCSERSKLSKSHMSGLLTARLHRRSSLPCK